MKKTEQIQIKLTKEEKETLQKLAEEMKGTNSQVLRLGLEKLKKEGENGTTN